MLPSGFLILYIGLPTMKITEMIVSQNDRFKKYSIKSVLTDCDDHQDGRYTESEREAGVLVEAFDIFAKNGCYEGGNQRSSVDGEVENGKEGLQLPILLRPNELVATESRNARFDASRPDSDDEQPDQWKCPAFSVSMNLSFVE